LEKEVRSTKAHLIFLAVLGCAPEEALPSQTAGAVETDVIESHIECSAEKELHQQSG
jgi:hypothetical protein